MKKILLLAVLICAFHEVQAQSFGKAILQGVLNGVREGVKQSTQTPQRRNNNSFSLENTHGTPIQGASSFSLENTHAESIMKEIKFNDGSRFYGAVVNGKPTSGQLSLSNGAFAQGGFDENFQLHGKCLFVAPDKSWYYGYFSHGKMHGEGSVCNSNGYFDVVCEDGVRVSSIAVSKPKYDKAELDATAAAAANMQMEMLQQQQYESTTTTSSSSSRNTSTSSRLCGVCYGSGKCNTCNGRGYYTAIGIGSGTHACPNCRNHNGLCSSCNGTGKR